MEASPIPRPVVNLVVSYADRIVHIEVNVVRNKAGRWGVIEYEDTNGNVVEVPSGWFWWSVL